MLLIASHALLCLAFPLESVSYCTVYWDKVSSARDLQYGPVSAIDCFGEIIIHPSFGLLTPCPT